MTLSVIIPTLNEEVALPVVLKALQNQTHINEVIVVDGGSEDATCALARAFGARVIDAPRGRGQQLCAGVEAAAGDVLWFLHADTVPQPWASGAIARALETAPDAPGGNFRVIFEGETPFAAWLTGFYAWLRSRGIYYGDSAVFVRRTIYDRIGGLRPTALMEDYDFNRRLEREGHTLNIEEPAVITSSRRFQDRRPWRIVLQWLVIHAMYYTRMSSEHMARLYRSADHTPGLVASSRTPDQKK
ncbi:MAG: TIGR04283 family arsenosugar biosynthesis glycosyltransferase [Pseudomonadota bacterium]